MTAPASGRPLLSRTVPVIVASPRVPFPNDGVTLVSKTVRAIRVVLNRKIFFIAARPPDKTGAPTILSAVRGHPACNPSHRIVALVLERKRLIDITLVRFSALRLSDALALTGMPDTANPLNTWARGTCTRLNAPNSQPRAGLVSSWFGVGMIKKCAAAES